MQEIAVDSAKLHNFAPTLCEKAELRSEDGDMKVKTRLFFILTLLMVLSVSTLLCFVRHAASTQLEPCPESVKAREDSKERCEAWKDGFPFYAVVFSPDGGMLAGQSIGTVVNLWRVSTGKIIRSFPECAGDFGPEVAFSPSGRTVVIVPSSEHKVCVWNGSAEETVHELVAYEEAIGGQVNSIAFSPDGRTVANGIQWNPDGNGFVRFWDVSTGKTLRKLEHPSAVVKIAFSPDGETLASWSADGIIRLWNVSSGEIVHTIEDMWSINTLVFSPDCRTLAVGSSSLRLWDVSTGEAIRRLNAENVGSIHSIAFSSDGWTLASVSGKFVHVWDVSTGEVLREIEADIDPVPRIVSRILSVTFGSGTLTGVSTSGKVLRWSVHSAPFQSLHPADVNCDGIVDIRDLVAVATALGQTETSPANVNSVGLGCGPCPGDVDVNADGVVDIRDLVAVTTAFGETVAGAPATVNLSHLSPETVQQWLSAVEQLNFTDPTSQRGIRFLEQLLLVLTPKETALLTNYPNPFNPETWIPYQLGTAADVTLRIHAMDGTLVRRLSLGYKGVGVYQSRSRAAYWDGSNQLGEPVASGLYFYTLSAGDFTATRKMLIRK